MNKNVVVIGSGLAGTLICNNLVEHRNVTLLEVGKKNRTQYPKIRFAKKPLGQVKTFCLGGGGTTNLWHNGLIPLRAEDINSEDFREVIVDAERFMNKAARNLYWLDNPYVGEFDKMYSQMNAVAEQVGVFSDGVDCLLYPKKHSKLEPDSRANAFYSVADLEFVSNGTGIKTVNFRADNRTHSIDADTIVISAGALGTPAVVKQVLAAMGLSSDHAGLGFADHPMGFVGKIKFKKEVDQSLKQFAKHSRRNYVCRTIVRLKSECGKYTTGAFFRPALTMNNNLSTYKYKTLLGASSGLDRLRNMLSLKIFRRDILAEIVSHLFDVTIPGRIYNILLVCEQKRGASKISYDNGVLDLDWCVSEEELQIYKDMLNKLKGMLSDLCDEVNINTDITEDWLWSGAHHSGTISLGEKEDDLVDKDLKLNSCDNVFVCDGSVLQDHSYANTGLTIGQLSMRLVEKVLNN